MCFPGLRLLQNKCYLGWVLRKMRLKWLHCWLWAPLMHIPSKSHCGEALLSSQRPVHIVLRGVKIVCTKYELVLLLIGFWISHCVTLSPGGLLISYSVKCYSKEKTSENNVRNILVILNLLMGVHGGWVNEFWGHSRNFTENMCSPRYSALLWWWISLSAVSMGSLSINCSNVRVFLEHQSAELWSQREGYGFESTLHLEECAALLSHTLNLFISPYIKWVSKQPTPSALTSATWQDCCEAWPCSFRCRVTAFCFKGRGSGAREGECFQGAICSVT